MDEQQEQRLRQRLAESGMSTDEIEEVMQTALKPHSRQDRDRAIRWFEARNMIEMNDRSLDDDTLDLLADEDINQN